MQTYAYIHICMYTIYIHSHTHTHAHTHTHTHVIPASGENDPMGDRSPPEVQRRVRKDSFISLFFMPRQKLLGGWVGLPPR